MELIIKASDLKYKYPKDTVNRDQPKFIGKPDPAPFNRDDIYDILPMLTAVMETLGSDDGRVLHAVEDIMNRDLPRFLESREEVYDFLVGTMTELLAEWQGR